MTNSGQIGVSVGRANAKKRSDPQSVSEYYQGVYAPLNDEKCHTDSGSSIGEEEQWKYNDMILADDEDDADGPEPVIIDTIQ